MTPEIQAILNKAEVQGWTFSLRQQLLEQYKKTYPYQYTVALSAGYKPPQVEHTFGSLACVPFAERDQQVYCFSDQTQRDNFMNFVNRGGTPDQLKSAMPKRKTVFSSPKGRYVPRRRFQSV